MSDGAGMTVGGALSARAFFGWAVRMFKDPRGFFRSMEKTGGYVTPCAYFLGWTAVSGVIGFLASFLRPLSLEAVGGRGVQALSVFVGPFLLLLSVFGFVAVYLHAIWHWMGSKENYQTAFRVWVFMAPLAALSTLLGVVPYLPLLVFPYLVYLLVVASQEVHGLGAERSWAVWGSLGAAVLLLVALTAGGSSLPGRGFPGARAARIGR
jgi:hypothetical protein